MEKQKVIVYVDGFNFYYGLKAISKKDKRWKKFYWLDVVSFFEKMLTDKQELIEVNYFSARPHDVDISKRQDIFFCANKLNPKFRLMLGKYLRKDIVCNKCGNIIHSYEEKETDVRIATQMINDVYKHRCDITIIVSADSDMIPSVELIREIDPNHKIYVYFPPLRHSVSLSNSCDAERKLSEFKARFNQSMLPDSVTLPNGIVINRPSNWI
ncbi:hypothetical protein FACS189474_3420 [Bacteroidia bacterium]|nr:hypothetical protein FACS189474_3420 [Bacteroidia bacterium]